MRGTVDRWMNLRDSPQTAADNSLSNRGATNFTSCLPNQLLSFVPFIKLHCVILGPALSNLSARFFAWFPKGRRMNKASLLAAALGGCRCCLLHSARARRARRDLRQSRLRLTSASITRTARLTSWPQASRVLPSRPSTRSERRLRKDPPEGALRSRAVGFRSYPTISMTW
jgi:hypothetical protein